MTANLDTILSYNTLDLSFFEIRGARSGVNNARSTGPVYVGGQYDPASNIITGSGSFAVDSTVSSFTFDAPYSSLTTSSLKVGDALTVDSLPFTVANIDTPTSFQLNTDSNLSGIYGISFNLGQREYVIEPDTIINTSIGIANFVSGDSTVTGSGTTWLTDIASGDFIKHDGYQKYFRVSQIVNDTELILVSVYTGDTTSGAYTAKKWIIGNTRVQYANNDIIYDDQAAKWRYDSIADNDITTSTNFLPLVDGIELAFTRALDTNDPDLMDVAVATNKTFARETQYDTFQFALPVVPYPESTMELFINDVKKIMFQDYVLTYSQNPVYTSPPAPSSRFVASIMFLDNLNNVSPSTALTETGQFSVTDSSGNSVGGIFPGSFSINIDGTVQDPYQDYLLESNTGTVEVIDSVVDEELVKYVGTDFSNFIDYGFTVYLNGIKQKISFPAEVDDDILFQTATGRLKPRDKDHPGPEEIYEINYLVETNPISDEAKEGTAGQTVVALNYYPVKQGSVLLVKNGTILEENIDFFVSYLTGRISVVVPLTLQDLLSISYTPLSKQTNDLSYTDDTWYCTVHDSRLTVVDKDTFKFSLLNRQIDASDIIIQRVYNETRDKDYDLTNIQTEGSSLLLEKNAVNISVGLDSGDLVIIDYTFESETVEYAPVVINNLTITEGTEIVYIEGSDLTPYITVGAILILVRPDAAIQYYFTIASSFYDSYGTRINLTGVLFEDVVNPKIFIGDSSLSYNTVPLKADYIAKGSTEVLFPGTNIQNIFRGKTVLDIKENLYQVSTASYDTDLGKTVVTLSSEILYDQTDSSSLSNIRYSDSPLYLEGDTELIPSKTVISLLEQPGFIMNYHDDGILSVSTTITELTVDSTTFSYSTYPTLNDLSSAMSSIPSLALTTYVPQWQSDKIEVVSDISVYRDSSTVLNVSEALRYKDVDSTAFEDTTAFSINVSGTVILDNALLRGDRYNIDYMGREFIGYRQVEYSAGYFVSLPAMSKVAASFQYINLDQFYVQILNQRDFFETVTIPRMREEATQLSGSVGQGGEVVGDEGEGNSQGGITGDEYARQDMEIECRVFQNIYDFYHYRLKAYGDEMEAALGLKLFNNDGMFVQVEQDAAYKTVSRIFPNPDNTNFEPMRVNPLTGYFFDTGAIFTQGSATVISTGNTLWTKQLNTGGFIGSTDTTRRYEISSINSDINLTLNDPYEENSSDINNGEPYTAVNTEFPLYDDDGVLNPKIIGTKNGGFNLISGDAFNIYLDGDDLAHKKDYIFEDPTDPFMASLYPVSGLDGPSVARLLSSNIDGLQCTSELVLDTSATYGYRTSLVLRGDSTVSYMKLGDNTTVEKLGFTIGDIAVGNYDRIDYSVLSASLYLVPPEIVLDGTEAQSIYDELGYLGSLVTLGIPDKLNRIIPAGLILAGDASNEVSLQRETIYEEIPKVEVQVSSTGHIIEETSIASADTSQAYLNATLMLTDTSEALAYADSIIPSWEGKGVDWKWVLDFTEHSQYVRGIDSMGIGVPISTGPGITPIAGQQTFILEAPSGNDRRILDATIFATYYHPVIIGETITNPIDGSWTGWEVSYDYSLNNKITFHLEVPPVINLLDVSMSVNNLRYVTDTTALNILWEYALDTTQEVFRYTVYVDVLSMKTAINTTIPGMSATGNIAYNSNICEAFSLGGTFINPSASVYPGLRNASVTYQTISNKILDDRISFDSDRSDFLTNRIAYLELTRGQQIKDAIGSEAFLLEDGEPGNLYVWANNRFHRRQGCYAKLKQIEQQIASNRSALQINKSFM